ncbi:MAG: MXAN_6640 family putative metalloprotease, partial [Dehalococcoidia bacterium]
RALARGEIDHAQHALYRALALFRPAQVERRFGRVSPAGRRDGTHVLLRLSRSLNRLEGAERSLAQRLLARPTDRRDPVVRYGVPARYRCNRVVCVFWVTRTRNAPPLRDRRPRNGVPDQVDLTLATFRQVWNVEIGQFGYSRPLSDRRVRSHGPNAKPDIYLADVGSRGLYGLCRPDRQSRTSPGHCIVDDDFSPRQFAGGTSGKAALQVTAAHEFLHNIQFGYDAWEDFWFFESTATWMEDEVYPLVNDNLQYLPVSPLSATAFWFPLDLDEPEMSKPEAANKYGAWILWRRLSELFGRDVVRDAWNLARGAPYGIQALEMTLSTRGQIWPDVFHQFAIANYFFRTSYTEGALYATVPGVGPQPQPLPVPFAGSIPMGHLSTDYYMFTPSPGSTNMSVTATLPGPETGPRASVVVMRPTGNDPPVPLTSGSPAIFPFDAASVTGILL